MGKRFYGSSFISLIIILFLSSLFSTPRIFAEQGTDVTSKDGRFIDNGDGTITDTNTGMMWTKKDSYADLGKCLNWNDSGSYVGRLSTGGYNDWRMPTVQELKKILEKSKSNNMTFDHNSKYPLYLDSIFADGAAYRLWSSETAGSCCARTVDFSRSNGRVRKYTRDSCGDRGVRAVRR